MDNLKVSIMDHSATVTLTYNKASIVMISVAVASSIHDA